MKITVMTSILAGVFSAFILSTSITYAAEGDDNEFAAGIRLVKTGEYKKGAAILRKVLETNPDNAEANYYLGTALNRTTAGKEAESFLKRSLMENPEDPAL